MCYYNKGRVGVSVMALQRESDEHDSTLSVWANYILAGLVLAGLFVLDYFTDKGFLDGTVVGMIIMKSLDSLTKMNDYFFPSRGAKSNDGNPAGR